MGIYKWTCVTDKEAVSKKIRTRPTEGGRTPKQLPLTALDRRLFCQESIVVNSLLMNHFYVGLRILGFRKRFLPEWNGILFKLLWGFNLVPGEGASKVVGVVDVPGFYVIDVVSPKNRWQQWGYATVFLTDRINPSLRFIISTRWCPFVMLVW